MQQVEWLDLPLWEAIEEAASEPEDADLASLWQEVEAAIAPLDCSRQLQVAGEAIVRITDVFEARSLRAFEEIQATTSHDGPLMPQDAFDRYVRQTMQVDFEQFIEPLPSLPRKMPDRQPDRFPNDGRSVVAVLDKETLLQALPGVEIDSDLDNDAVKQKLLDIAHAEDVEVWVSAIANCFGNTKAECLMLAQLVREVQELVAPEDERKDSSPIVKTWLALLLGGFQLEQRLEFYDFEGIWVSLGNRSPKI
ncbi:hypothetical protein B7486_41390 [cyanobacterium TDX16]|nr:hypothetical protein B7486_41390 [cyanobacterium TDX16]